MGHSLKVNDSGDFTIQPLAYRCTAIKNMARPTNPKKARRFVGAINYLSGFFPHVQTILRPLHHLSRKHKRFNWTGECETAFNKIKELMTSPPVLHLPKKEGIYSLYSDTSRYATGAYVTQTVNGKENLLGYYSKILPNACQRYSVTELELFGLYINISAFKYLLRGCSTFNAFVDHSAIVQILKSKDEPPTSRLQKLLLKLSDYSFQVGYKKDTEIVLADLLSRSPRDDDSEIDQIVPIAFSANNDSTHLEFANPIVTRSYAKKMGIEIPDLFPKKKSEVSVTEDSPQESSRPIPPESGVQNLEKPSPVSVDIPETDSNARKESNQSGVSHVPNLPVLPPVDTQSTNLPEPRLADRIQVPHDHREVPPELYSPPRPLIAKIKNWLFGTFQSKPN